MGIPSFKKETRLVLEHPSASKQEDFLQAVHRSKALHRGFVAPPKDAEAYQKWLDRIDGPAHSSYLIYHASDGLVGVVSLSEIVRGVLQSAYLGYYIFTPHQGKGYMTFGLGMVIDAAFGKLRLHRLEANIQPQNAASIALVKRLGFHREGYSSRYLKIAGRWRDHERWAILKEDWRRRR